MFLLLWFVHLVDNKQLQGGRSFVFGNLVVTVELKNNILYVYGHFIFPCAFVLLKAL